jgi:hypothetical protein
MPSLKVCQPAHVALVTFAVIGAVWLWKHAGVIGAKSLAPIASLLFMALYMGITLDLYCKADHTSFAWVLAGLAIVTYAFSARSMPPVTDVWVIEKDQAL